METTNLTCICCPIGCDLTITKKNQEHEVTGNKCPRGKKFATEEITAPKRMVTSTVKIDNSLCPVIPVKTEQPIPKEKIFDVIKCISSCKTKTPVEMGDILIENVANTGINIIATKKDYGK